MYKNYIATRSAEGRGDRIISVLAENEDDARKQIVEQLSRPGRTDYLAWWRATGEHILVEELKH
jgi:hypothetical protein